MIIRGWVIGVMGGGRGRGDGNTCLLYRMDFPRREWPLQVEHPC